jgi:MFS transporter, FSR family, fosmidomycin resistance protein
MTTATLQPPHHSSTASVPLKQDAAIIGMVGLVHASSHFAHLILPLMFPVFMKEFGLSYSELADEHVFCGVGRRAG